MNISGGLFLTEQDGFQVRHFNVQYYTENPNYNNPPVFSTRGSACFDIQASKDAEIPPKEFQLVHTGLHMYLPDGFEIQIRSRSGLAAKNGIFVLNSPGTIDPDYAGEICVILANFGKKKFVIEAGDRIAQGIVKKLIVVDTNNFRWDALPSPIDDNGHIGFGSTGVK
jgi:dUTP pyrophosphatase